MLALAISILTLLPSAQPLPHVVAAGVVKTTSAQPAPAPAQPFLSGLRFSRTNLSPQAKLVAPKREAAPLGTALATSFHGREIIPPAISNPDLGTFPDNPRTSKSFTVEAKGSQKKRLWLLLVTMQHGAAAFDAYATREAISSGSARELNPLMRPFASSAAIYPASQAGPSLLDYLSYRMMSNRRGWVRSLWWVPQTAMTAGSLWAGSYNLKMARPH